MEAENKDLLIEGAKTFGVSLDEKAMEAFELYLKELLKWNQKINLTAIRTEKGVILKHFLDSLSVCPYLPGASFLLDLGSGAGFPGIPLKIVQPSFEVTLIDSVLKKVDFQRHIIRILGLKGIEAVHGRVQEKGVLKEMERRFDIVISRAFSDLETFLRLSFPFLRKGGRVVAMKGEVDEGGLQLASKAEEIRFAFQKTESFTLPFSSFNRTVLLFEKR